MIKIFIKAYLPIIFLLYGLYYFLEPFLSGWFEVVNPSIARTIFLPLDWMSFAFVAFPLALIFGEIALHAPDFLFIFFFACYTAYYFWIGRHKNNVRQKYLALSPLIIFPLLFVVMLPLGFTAIDRRVGSFPIGGWSRLVFAGGPSRVHEEAIWLLNNTEEQQPDRSKVPPALKRLGGWITIEHENDLVILRLGRTSGMADEFGFVFQETDTDEPGSDYLAEFNFLRFWKLADAVYFYEAD